jgi:hypothetical protein
VEKRSSKKDTNAMLWRTEPNFARAILSRVLCYKVKELRGKIAKNLGEFGGESHGRCPQITEEELLFGNQLKCDTPSNGLSFTAASVYATP